MNDAASKSDTQDIVVDEVFPHAPETIWKTLTTGELIGRWIEMAPTGFEPVKGKHFTFQTTPAGARGTASFTAGCWRRSRTNASSTPGKADTKETSDTARGWTLSLRGPFPGSRTERAFALSTPALRCRRTILLSRS
jgi:hypothetical protein